MLNKSKTKLGHRNNSITKGKESSLHRNKQLQHLRQLQLLFVQSQQQIVLQQQQIDFLKAQQQQQMALQQQQMAFQQEQIDMLKKQQQQSQDDKMTDIQRVRKLIDGGQFILAVDEPFIDKNGVKKYSLDIALETDYLGFSLTC